MLGLIVVSKLNVGLKAGELASQCLSDRVSGVEDSVSRLNVEEVELDWISRINVLIGKEEFPAEENGLTFSNTLLPERFTTVHPIHCQNTILVKRVITNDIKQSKKKILNLYSESRALYILY